MSATLSSAPSKALDDIFHGAGGNQNIFVLDYRDPDTFTSLWLYGLDGKPAITIRKGAGNALRLDSAGQNAPEREQEILATIQLQHPATVLLLVGNDPPEAFFASPPASFEGINFRSHFTAASWLAARKLRKFVPAAESREQQEPSGRIAVIDPRSSDFAQSPARELQALLGARSGDKKALVPRATVFNEPTLRWIAAWIESSDDEPTETPPASADLLKSTIWNALTSDRERHHAISNILGASLLAAEMGKSASVFVQPFIRAFVGACGIRAESPREHESWMPVQLQGKLPAAALIDDMSDLWGDFVQGALGRSVPLRTCEKGKFAAEMKELPARLTKVLEEIRRTLNISDLFPTPVSEGTTTDFVLFLDLRLHLGDKFRAALSQVGWLLLQSERNLPWLEKGRERLESDLIRFADTTLPEKPENPNDPEETLLPRLLSLIDPTLPIVIFSSTHSTDLSDPFRDYGNIITTFRKPVLSGLNASWAQMVKELRTNFASAMEQASRIIETRKLMRGACAK